MLLFAFTHRESQFKHVEFKTFEYLIRKLFVNSQVNREEWPFSRYNDITIANRLHRNNNYNEFINLNLILFIQ